MSSAKVQKDKNLTPSRKKFIIASNKMFGEGAILTRTQIEEVQEAANLKRFPAWMVWKGRRTSRGKYQVPMVDELSYAISSKDASVVRADVVEFDGIKVLSTNGSTFSTIIPKPFDGYVAWGHHVDIEKIISSNIFFPIFVTGLSGNGKTLMVHEICSGLSRELIRVNVTKETDEDDLFGGFRLINGETVFHKGPVIEAMERGALLLLDEVDLGTEKIMCLQPVLEGSGVFLKKINQQIDPKVGFNIIATANTKGKGDDEGRFMFTNVLNEAFLERFAICLEQPYPKKSVEKKIVRNSMKKYNCEDGTFVDHLVNWARSIRKTFEDDAIDEVISTRRLDHIVRTFSIFGDKLKAIQLCINRFDDDTKEGMLEAYRATDPSVVEEEEGADLSADDVSSEITEEDYPF